MMTRILAAADEGVHPDGLDKTTAAANKVALRQLPPAALE